MDGHLRSAIHPLLGRLRIGAPRLWPLPPEFHTSDYSFACPGSSTWVDKVTSRDTPSLNLADCRGGVAPDNPQVALRRAARACESLSSVLLLDPIHGGGHAEHAHEAAGRLLVAGRNRTPLLEAGPETLDAVAVHVDLGRARDGRLIALGRDRWTRAELPDEGAECLTGVAAIGHNPGRDEGEKRQEQWGQRQFMRLPTLLHGYARN